MKRKATSRNERYGESRRWDMRTARVMALAIAVGFVAMAGIALPAHAALKVAPTARGPEPGPPVPITDPPTRRMVDGSVALFRFFGIETVLPLRTHKPYNTAQSRLPSRRYGGGYTGSPRPPDGPAM